MQQFDFQKGLACLHGVWTARISPVINCIKYSDCLLRPELLTHCLETCCLAVCVLGCVWGCGVVGVGVGLCVGVWGGGCGCWVVCGCVG